VEARDCLGRGLAGGRRGRRIPPAPDLAEDSPLPDQQPDPL